MARKSSKTSKSAKTTSTKAATPVATPVPAEPVAAADAAQIAQALRKPDFIDRVVERSGAKKRDVKPIMEAALALLGETLERGEDLNLPPLGKIKVVRQKSAENAEVVTCRLRRPHQMRDGAAITEKAAD